jgi:hypothetical protein
VERTLAKYYSQIEELTISLSLQGVISFLQRWNKPFQSWRTSILTVPNPPLTDALSIGSRIYVMVAS